MKEIEQEYVNKQKKIPYEIRFSNEETRWVADNAYGDKRLLAFCRAILDDCDTLAEQIDGLKYALPTGEEFGDDIDRRKVKWEEIVTDFLSLKWGKDIFRDHVE